ncbi:WSC-domain-containing protein [Choiromyces venosus 120613-1]|uniref:WSC-domain-containing protein n=1 Tax=Choiromyces venosus 120613-1 TaxID=1336337 RepID=A0A3N4JPM1_9PEZI|nr:WSC-domain-containing protein [Choiromyces venosus 120613-1]
MNGTQIFMAKPLVYTPRTRFTNGKPASGDKQLVIAISESNWIYVLDAKSGDVINSRQIRKPYQASDLPCADITPAIGVTGTPVIDPATDTIYAFAKGYSGNATGWMNAGYFVHALDILTLEERSGFPTTVGGPADNDPERYFNGGIHLQRPALKIVNGIVLGGFGGGCGEFNQTGWIAGVDTQTGTLKTLFVTESGPEAPAIGQGFYTGGGGGSVWQAGIGFPSDRKDRFFFVGGNGIAFNATMKPSAGNAPPSLLEGCVVNMKIDSSGKISPQDYFRPYNYPSYGSSSRDLGSGGLTILDPNYFSGKNVKRLAIAAGKNGFIYLVDLDNLGGYRQGVNGTDAVLQALAIPGISTKVLIYGSTASYPLEGGYIYLKPVGLRTVLAYKFGQKDGMPFFSLVAQTNESVPTNVGVGVPIITSYQGQPGTGIVWILDLILGLTAYKAVPENGNLVSISIPALAGRPKFQRPVFGDRRLYVATTDGQIICYGNSKDKLLQVQPIIGAYSHQGCFTESTPGGALSQKALSSDAMTVEVCEEACRDYIYFGVEYGRECYCGSSLAPNATLVDNPFCDVPCAGNSSERCGGRRHLNVYKK